MSRNSIIVLIYHRHKRSDLIFSLMKEPAICDGYCKCNEIYCSAGLTRRQGPRTGKLLTLPGNHTPTVGLQFKEMQIILKVNVVPVLN
jgi:hypothetical protein